MAEETIGGSVRTALGNDNLTKEEALKHVEENWDNTEDGGQTVGEKLHDFFLVTPTGKNLGLPQKEKLSKEEALKAIEDAWEHPLGKPLPVSESKDDDGPHKTWGEKLHDFFLVVPTGKNLGLPQKEKVSKDEALKKIEDAWEHPFHHPEEEVKGVEEHEKKQTVGDKLYEFFFVVPTDENMGMPQVDKMSKEEALKKIESAWEKPLKGKV
ncbi:expressed unknown protein [Seminavis robusta]|uniref:Uncharacterized protein n=1 Tax=Seminavis robusta TaxID=568900 RepID=A0A9N8H6C8_9STRA|nr:expressed unknown protein [Seminavis robusta]|eukprot:Sro96_g049740.1 n/a (211) ;mRNA; r:113732-114364